MVDATAGLGRDAASLALAGYEVTACERAPAVAALWKAAKLPNRLRFAEGDARVILRAFAVDAAPDAVFIDPMYPDDERKSAPQRELLELRALVGKDDDAAELLAIARDVARVRVVVKRPRKAPPLAASPNHSWDGASTRFDLYLRG